MPPLLTAEIAEQFCEDADSIDLNTFTEIDPEAGVILGQSSSDVHLNSLTSLSPDIAGALAACEADLSLNSLRELDADVAAALATHSQGALSCDGLTHIADDTARMLMRHPGYVSLRGISALSPKVSCLFAFAAQKFTLGCPQASTPNLRDLSTLWGPLPNAQFLTVGWPAGSQMLFAVGANHRAQDVGHVIDLIRNSGSFLPPQATLVPEPNNAHDPNAVAVVFPTQQFGPQGAPYGAGIKVGYLQRNTAVSFKQGCAMLGLGDAPVEVLACILVGQGPDDAGTIKLYLPTSFVELVVSGYASDPCSQLAWLASPTPVPKKEITQNRAKDYTLDEQRKMYCRYAQYKGWNCLPDSVEDKVAGWQSRGLGPMGLAWAFHQEGRDTFPSDDNASTISAEQVAPATTREQTDVGDGFSSHTSREHTRNWTEGASRKNPKVAGRSTEPQQVDASETARGANLKTLFKAWGKWRKDATAHAARTNSKRALEAVLAAGDAAFLERYRGILEEEFEVAEEKACEKNGDRARARVFLQLLERVRKATELESWPGVDDAFEDFEIKCEAWA